MAITSSETLSLREWYLHDNEYWGMDYPPLCMFTHKLLALLICPSGSSDSHCSLSVSSRGSVSSLPAMRLAVLSLDLLLLFPAVHLLSRRLHPRSLTRASGLASLLLLYPLLPLVDYSHFQVGNGPPIALALLSVWCYTSSDGESSSLAVDFLWKAAGCFAFVSSLMFKQISLYYAPVIFSFLLAWCLSPRPGGAAPSPPVVVSRFLLLSLSTLSSFLLYLLPFLLDSWSPVPLSVFLPHLFRRLFPFGRGLFESKVANVWCALDTHPVNIRSRLPPSYQALAALCLTLLLAAPSVAKAFALGKRRTASRRTACSSKNDRGREARGLLLCLASCALAFFLASFHVHEKSILFPAFPLLFLLLPESSDLVSESERRVQGRPSSPSFLASLARDNSLLQATLSLFLPASILTCLPLFTLDGVQTTAHGCLLLSLLLPSLVSSLDPSSQSSSPGASLVPPRSYSSFRRLLFSLPPLLLVVGLSLEALRLSGVLKTEKLPHLHELLVALWGVVVFGGTWAVVTTVTIVGIGETTGEGESSKGKKKAM